MEKGISKYWTPEKEAWGERLIKFSPNFAARHLMITVRDMLKYDGRTKAGRRVEAQARLRLATATDEDLEIMAKIYIRLSGEKDGTESEQEAKELEYLKKDRDFVREKGIKRSAVECP